MGLRTLLVWPDSRNEVLGWGDLGAIAEPLALEYLGTALKNSGHEVRVLDLRLHREALAPTLESYRPQLVGVTAFSMHVRRALAIAAEAKCADPEVATVIGGHHATFLPEDFIAPQVDYVVSGEGSGIVCEIASALAKGARCLERPGLIDAASGGGKRATIRVPIRDEFDAMPFPDRGLTASDHHRYFIDWMRPVALLRTTAGCPYRCSFCSIWPAMGGHYFIRDNDRVVEELSGIEQEFVFLVDDEAFINGKRMIRLAQAIAAAGIRKKYFTYCRVDTLLRNRDAIEVWRDIGLTRLFVGIDAISAKDLREYRKGCSIAQIEAGIRAARKIGVDIFAQFVVNTDYEVEDFQALVRFIEHNRIEYPSFTVLTPLPGTALLPSFDAVVERQPNGRPNWDMFDCQNAVTATRLPKAEFRHHYRNLYKVFKGAYTQYRDYNVLVDEAPAEDALASGHPTSAVRVIQSGAREGAPA